MDPEDLAEMDPSAYGLSTYCKIPNCGEGGAGKRKKTIQPWGHLEINATLLGLLNSNLPSQGLCQACGGLISSRLEGAKAVASMLQVALSSNAVAMPGQKEGISPKPVRVAGKCLPAQVHLQA